MWLIACTCAAGSRVARTYGLACGFSPAVLDNLRAHFNSSDLNGSKDGDVSVAEVGRLLSRLTGVSSSEATEAASAILTRNDFCGSASRSGGIDFFEFIECMHDLATATRGTAGLDGQHETTEAMDLLREGSKRSVTQSSVDALGHVNFKLKLPPIQTPQADHLISNQSQSGPRLATLDTSVGGASPPFLAQHLGSPDMIPDEEEASEHVGKRDKWYIFHPRGLTHALWDLFVSGVLMLTVLTMPISLAFTKINSDMFGFNFAVDLIFILDLIKSFFTG